MKKVYLAGPDVFRKDAIAVGQRYKDLCLKFGFQGLYPMDNQFDDKIYQGNLKQLARDIYYANLKLIHEADFGIFNMTPFRGPSADVGTVFELAYMTALQKPTFGYSDECRTYADRVIEFYGEENMVIEGNSITDPDGMSTENFGEYDNLMLDGAQSWNDYFITEWVDTEAEVGSPEALEELFVSCLKDAQKYFRHQIALEGVSPWL